MATLEREFENSTATPNVTYKAVLASHADEDAALLELGHNSKRSEKCRSIQAAVSTER
jgi:hypothetical protein